jgi:RNA polymerase sigma factor (sigma-70 family)
VETETLYLSNLTLIERVIGAVCRRHRLSAADAEDFGSTARLHLIDDDYAALRKFEGRSSMATYLTVVITRQFQDWRNAKWGKWRASAEARRQGPVAVHLERLIVRDRLSMEEAVETLRTNFSVDATRAELEALIARIPPRTGRTFVPDDELEQHAAPAARADNALADRHALEAAHTSSHALSTALRGLPAQDRLILKMRFQDDLSVAEVARLFHLEQKPLYRRIQKLLVDLRAALEAQGFTAASALEALESGGFELLPDDQGTKELWGEVRPFMRDGRPGASAGTGEPLAPAKNVRAE